MTAVPLFLDASSVPSISGENSISFGSGSEAFNGAAQILSQTARQGAFAFTFSLYPNPFFLLGQNENNWAVPPRQGKFWKRFF